MLADALLLVAAGAACGMVNAVAGGGSLILFPALLVTGLTPISANVTNSVAAWPGYVGGAGALRRDLRERGTELAALAGVTAVGALGGCVLLLATPAGAFDVVVPVLVLVATVMTALQPRVRRALRERRQLPGPGTTRAALVAVLAASMYGGYFGGALGVIVLAVLGMTSDEPIRTINASKSVVTLTTASVSLAIFGVFGPVDWRSVAIAAPAALAGGYVGGRASRLLDERSLRVLVVGLGAAVTVALAARLVF